MNPAVLMRRLLGATMLGLLVYAGFVVHQGYREIGAELSRFRWVALGGALGLSLSNYLLRFLKWEFYLGRLSIRGIPKLDSLLTFFSGFVLTVSPGKVGEVFKSVVLAETHGVEASRTAPIVVAERLTDLIGIIVLVIVGSVGFPGGMVWAGVGAAAVVGALLVISSRAVPEALVRWMEARHGALLRMAPRVRTAWTSLRQLTTPGALGVPVVLSVLSWSLEALSLWVILWGFGAGDTSLPLSVFVYATSQLVGALIPVPGGLGFTEGSLKQQLIRFGHVPDVAATGATILVRLATLWFAVLLGFVALAVLRRRHPRLLSGQSPAATSVLWRGPP